MTAERQHPVEFSIDAAVFMLKALNINYSLSYNGQYLKTYTCILTDTEGTYITQGHGKGIGEQSKASAIFEALEHYYSFYISPNDPANRVIQLSKLLLTENLLPKKCMDLINHQSDRKILCKLYQNLSTEETRYFPIFLSATRYSSSPVSTDNFSYSYLDIYSTNSGTSVGVTLNEALIHAINELVERHCFSRFLIDSYLNRTPSKIKTIDKGTLPESLLLLVNQVEKEAHDPLIILDISTDFGVPVFFVSFSSLNVTVQPSGCGCSLSKSYALERAILGALQSFHLYDTEIEREDQVNLKKFELYKRYQQCLKCDLAYMINKGLSTGVSFEEDKIQIAPINLSDYLNTLVEIITAKRLNIFYSSIGPAESNFFCVHVIIPGLEKFNLVRNGLPLIPIQI
jgi:ribosomal protein S12 methylthiotransferase accessory factor